MKSYAQFSDDFVQVFNCASIHTVVDAFFESRSTDVPRGGVKNTRVVSKSILSPANLKIRMTKIDIKYEFIILGIL